MTTLTVTGKTLVGEIVNNYFVFSVSRRQAEKAAWVVQAYAERAHRLLVCRTN